MWPKLESKYLETIGIENIESVADVLLSNAGKYIQVFGYFF